MMVTSDSTALIAIKSEMKTGKSMETNRGSSGAGVRTRPPASLAITTKSNTGMTMVPTTPSGSRTKILISSQVRRQSPRSMCCRLRANLVAGHTEEHVLECRHGGAEFGHSNVVLGEAADHVRHQIVAAS